MGSVNLQQHLTEHLNLTMKFLILASLFVLSVFAEPEAEPEADAQYYNRGYGYGYRNAMTYGYSGYPYNGYNNYNSYNYYNHYNPYFYGQRRFVREAEAEPEAEAEADAQYYNHFNRGFYGCGYGCYGYSGYP